MSQTVSPPLYAAIDLGSNSFHMLVVRHIDGSVQTMAKIKRKVRLAAGLDENNALSTEAMQRGWDCLSLFAERLQDIPKENIRIVGTATLRTAINVDIFLEKANQILGYDINVISGEEEAATIYKGVAHTSGGSGRRLVVDIGGASTEMIIGEGFSAKALTSLKMGCVTWLERHFKDRQLTATNFNNAIEAAKSTLAPILDSYTDIGWDVCVGASGTVQALQEIMLAQGMDEVITHAKLKRLQKQAMITERLEELEIEGLTLERALVFPSGLSILIAIFELLEIDSMTLAGGALREGLAYEMVDELRQEDIRARTIKSVQSRYQMDVSYGEQVAVVAQTLLDQAGAETWVSEPQAGVLLQTAAKLHEIGLTIDFKKGGEHSAYLLQNLDLPGFTRAQKHYLGELTRRYREQLTSLPEQHAISGTSSKRILRILRLAILLTHRRNPDLEPQVTLTANGDNLTLTIDKQWLASNPLTAAELEIESNRQTDIGWPLTIAES
ncbi:Guanosine-5'-triphosphate,3'-diphosphate pyrophosphatase [Vibrio coralliirubri]|uniref:Guanosine-5'-triphosphate,3'-diphosphate pyrophosphatase n=1 Tax=Vibrio coralliirubri TaxID=1516159 RepID=A0AA86XPL2_9VIBR|nr:MULTISPECIES: guanosine-5'-triphosphate,3'-diphosphate diphosphatase [Vibrio]MCK8088543.1 guanosine-5'-triphosphate,3'-diphosphate diphosphatase [Vibrio sp. 1CM8B]CDT71560.1 Guanosine-5'-triphosphate,3'-diphosphate pyrophosphatase [Vibrio coralliirubri]CDT82310.1 Guanosine-5'-triphosphate,3'-diphosphate pyrophosphatase [Vibrio coralliirubri]CDT88041.1 Guanosine-5'-triphosphate,3'-diphosphate pyrophosphatase [Vibrio coralliirubri]CDT98866.1 Guanosine-5'-triphosphate,3'-diphosphate pyrophosph